MRRVLIFLAITTLLIVGVIWFFVQFEERETDPTDASRCRKPPSNTINTVATGIRHEVVYNPDTAVLVEIAPTERDTANWPRALYAVQITPKDQAPAIAVWGVGNPRGLVLPIVALNQPAIENSTWGTRENDQSADANRRFASGLAEQRLIESCVATRVSRLTAP